MKIQNEISCKLCGKRGDSIFCHSSDESINEIDCFKNCIQYKKGQTIFQEGGYPLGLYCISSGKIKLSQIGSEGKEQIVRFAKDGDVLGYRALLGGDRYSASAVALEEVSVCFIPKETFIKVVSKDERISMEVMKKLAEDLKAAQEKITILAQKPVRERMAETLLFIKETFGTEEDGQTLNVTLSREEIANLVGTAKETAIRLLSDLKSENTIDLIGKKIKIVNMNELIRTANLYD